MKRDLPYLAKRLRIAAEYFTRRPLWCAWQVTYRCNFRCDFCGYWKLRTSVAEEAPVEMLAEGAERLGRLGTLFVSLAGGEPLLRTDIVEIVEAFAHRHVPFITTNGWLVTKDLARDLFRAGLFGASVSVDYASADRHDRARGIRGAFDRAVAALETFAGARTDASQRVNLMMTLTRGNVGEVEPLARLASRLDVNFMIQPYGALKTGDRSHVVDRPVAAELLRVHRRFPNFVSNPRFLARFDEASNGGVGDCQAGVSFFNIDERGDVSPCVELRRKVVVGNMLADDPREIARRLRRYRPRNNCRACWYNCRGEMESLYSMRGILAAMPNFWLKPGSSLGRPSGR